MDLIYTDKNKIDQGTLANYAFDLSFGAAENDFELTLDTNDVPLEYGSYIYIEGTEYGGTVDGTKASTNGDTITYMGRTWHGILNSNVIEPDTGDDYLTVSGDANDILASLITRFRLSSLFVADESNSGVCISGYQFPRYCKGYDGISAMLSASGAKLKIKWDGRLVKISAEPIADHTQDPVDGDTATLTAEYHQKKVNHLICLGRGELKYREVVHLFVNQFGDIVDNSQYYTGIDEISEVYDNNNSESLKEEGIEKFKELLNINKASISLKDVEGKVYDIGDIVSATENKSGITVTSFVSQKIVRINNGVIGIEYKTGGEQA